jgi:UDP-N-acetylglucosamine--N-acetylmuramyl-(pentapeptide) pyrophosphoryl-undecaprenol N-acetylglucosamine transferase
MAAMRLPSLLVPLPTAADNHQFFNASAFDASGAAQMLAQKSSPQKVAAALVELVGDETKRQKIQMALAQWHQPEAAGQIAENILNRLGDSFSPARSGGETASLAGKIHFKAVS